MTRPAFPIAILAGGLATRLRPLTETVPKSLLDVNGSPFIAHQLRLLRSAGLRQVVICAGHLGEMIRDCVGDGAAFDLDVRYCFDGPKLLGTAGALRKARPLLGDRFQVIYGDSYLTCDYLAVQEAFLRARRKALMTVYRNQGQYDASNVEFAGGEIIAYDKKRQNPRMQHIDYGLGIFEAAALEVVPADEPFDLAVLYARLLADGQLAAFEVAERFYEIGSNTGLEEIRQYLTTARGNVMTTFSQEYLAEAATIVNRLDTAAVERMVDLLVQTRDAGGRLFVLGVGGSAANASHAVNDFRKIVGLETYAPTDNVSELTARTNDEGWPGVFEGWLRVSRLRPDDLVLVLSVGGGNLEKNVSPNLVLALQYAKKVGAKVIGIVGRDGGYTAQVADACVIIPTVNPKHTTPHAEAFQAVVWHLLVSHPRLQAAATKWESVV